MIFDASTVEDLVRVWRAGDDQAALERILVECQALAEVIASSYSNDSNYREDLIQECLARVPNALNHWSQSIGPIHKYLTSVFRNRCITCIQQLQRQDRLSNQLTDIDVYTVNPESSDNILQDLVERNRSRFPSIATQVIDGLTCHIYEYLMNGSEPGKGRGVIKKASDNWPLDRHSILIVYHSSLVYLRSKYESFAVTECNDPDELSLLPELIEALGVDAYNRLKLLFDGMNIRVS